MATLARALEIATEAHADQTDKNGAPYINHPLRVAAAFDGEAGPQGETLSIIALLHDVVEDAPDWSLQRLREEGFSDEVLDAIDHLTRREDEEYEDFVKRAMQNPLARRVKRADLRDNMDITRLRELDKKAVKRLRRYLAAWQVINEEG